MNVFGINAFHGASDASHRAWADLASYSNRGYRPGRGLMTRCLWYVVSLLVFESGWFPASKLKCWLLRLFGARLGKGVVIKPQVRIKYPWRLSLGDHCWIGQEAWIDNLADVQIGHHVCISQRVYICTGSHDYRERSFDLITRSVQIHDGAWLGAGSLILAGNKIGANAIVAAGSVVTKDVGDAAIVAGNPAKPLARQRTTDSRDVA